MLGSSKTYITSTRLLPRCLTILMRCDSPPGQRIGFSIKAEVFQANIDHVLQPFGQVWPPLARRLGPLIALMTSISSSTSIAASSAMLYPLILQLSAAWLRRAPLQRVAGPVTHVGRNRFLGALRHGFHIARDVLLGELVDNPLECEVDSVAPHLDFDL